MLLFDFKDCLLRTGFFVAQQDGDKGLLDFNYGIYVK